MGISSKSPRYLIYGETGRHLLFVNTYSRCKKIFSCASRVWKIDGTPEKLTICYCIFKDRTIVLGLVGWLSVALITSTETVGLLGTGAQDGHLDFRTAPEFCLGLQSWLLVECCFTSTETVGLLGTGAQDGHFDFHTAPELCAKLQSSKCFI